MYVELIEFLRCPRCRVAGRESNLVASSSRSEARHIIDGTLGCPECSAEYPIRQGVTHFAPPPPPWSSPVVSTTPDAIVRTAALLELTDNRGFAILCGSWASQVDALREMTETPFVLVNPSGSIHPEAAAATLVVGEQVPLAAGSARALALESPSDTFAAWAVASVRVGGRIIGTATEALPTRVTELARDDDGWVGEKSAAPSGEPETPRLVSLKRAGR